MFTGIIEAVGEVIDNTGSRLVLTKPAQFDDLKIGSSIAVSGVCLSIISFNEHQMSFDVVDTTKSKTKIGLLQTGDMVNLERAMSADGRFEGHIVQGHIEGVGKVVSLRALPPPPLTPPPNAYGIVGGGEQQEDAIQVRGIFGRVYRSIGSLRFPCSSTIDHARAMRKRPTDAENILWQAIRGRKLQGLYFRRQRPVGKYILDFYCDTLRLGIEVDGEYHDHSLEESDDERSQYLQNRGVMMMRFANEEIMNNLDECLVKITSFVPLHQQSRSDLGEGIGVGATSFTNSQNEQCHKVEEGATSFNYLHIDLPPHLRPYCIPEGSITLDGVSLTIANLSAMSLTVALIPHTLHNTTLGSLKEGDSVNIETDVLGRYAMLRVRS